MSFFKTSIAAIALASSVASFASASDFTDKLYLKGETGYSFFKKGTSSVKTTGNSFIFGLGVGTEVAHNFRTDLTFSLRNGYKSKWANAISQDVKVTSFMINGYYDIPVSSDVVPYVGLGLGLANVNPGSVKNFSGTSSSKTSSNLSYSLATGVGINMSKDLIVDLGYKYSDFGSYKLTLTNEKGSGTGKVKVKAHELLAGIRFKL